MTDLFDEDDFDIPESAGEEEFDLDSLRATSARAGSMFDEEMEEMDLEMEPLEDATSSGFSLSRFSPGQRLVLALLLLFDIIAIGIGILVVTGRL